MITAIARAIARHTTRRAPDFFVGGRSNPYHDHPAASFSIGLWGRAIEHTIAAGGVHHRRELKAGTLRCRSAHFAHRIEILPGESYFTLFIFFRNCREWGFHCPNGWVHWKKFVASDDPGSIGSGCGEKA